MTFLQFAPAFGDADAEPVSGPISCAAKTGPLDEGFQQDRPVAILAEPVGRQTTTHPAQHAGGQIGAAHPRQEQEAVIVEHQVEVALALEL